MSLKIECAECGYQGRVSPAKAGQQIPCPSCDTSLQVPAGAKAASARKVRRPKTDTSSGPYIALGGATVLLAGVLLMMWVKKNQLGDEQFLDGVLPGSGAAEQQTAGDNTGSEESTPVETDGGDPPPPVEVVGTGDGSQPPADASETIEVTQVGENGAVDQGDVILPEISAVAPETLLLAGMTEVVLQLEGFAADTRGAVENAVTAEVQSELKKCRLSCVDTNNRPSFVVTLDLRQDGGVQKLGMTAELLGEVSGVPVSIWKQDAALIPVEAKTLNGTVGLPGLDREVARFFTPLRDKLNTARTSIEAIRKNRERREQARRTGGRQSS